MATNHDAPGDVALTFDTQSSSPTSAPPPSSHPVNSSTPPRSKPTPSPNSPMHPQPSVPAPCSNSTKPSRTSAQNPLPPPPRANSSQQPPKPATAHFVDFDQPDEFAALETWSCSLDSRNFVLDFDNAVARCARDLDEARMTQVLEQRAGIQQPQWLAQQQSQAQPPSQSQPQSQPQPQPQSQPQPQPQQARPRPRGTRWINIWKPEEQPGVIRRIGRHYGFSARLVASMCCPQTRPTAPSPAEAGRHEHRTVSEYIDELMQPWRSHSKKGSGGRANDPDSPSTTRRRARRPPGPKQAAAVTRQLDREASTATATTATVADEEWSMLARVVSSQSGSGAGAGGLAPPRSLAAGFDLDFYRLVQDVWHFSSVDWGARFLCIGFNSLYRVEREIDVDSYRPAGKRVWTWLVLCDDGTVVAMHENPYPGQADASLLPHQARTVAVIRRNLRNIFRQLSRGFDDRRLQNMLETIKLRSNLGSGGSGSREKDIEGEGAAGGDFEKGQGTAVGEGEDDNGNDKATAPPQTSTNSYPDITEEEAPSLLFYYLFDDWFTSYSLVARREHQYGVELDLLRDRMFHRAELEHVSRLHHYGRQLAVLKRIYGSYATIIQRVLDGPQAQQSPAGQHIQQQQQQQHYSAAAAGMVPNYMSDSYMAGVPPSASSMLGRSSIEIGDGIPPGARGQFYFPGGPPQGSSYGVGIAVSASTRFRRLRDRINMYAIGEIQDCIEEKNALMELNFNLITLKESSYIEGLTRITILLAKVTILFLPVSFVTAYFTVEFTQTDGSGPVQYNVRQYWATFAVVIIVTALGLTMFGKLSGTQEGKPIYESFTKLFIKGWTGLWHRGRRQAGARSNTGGAGTGTGTGTGIGDVAQEPDSPIKLQALSQ